MKRFRIKNLKAIKDSGTIELKPMNVVIGKNSSGKSTLLRVFPLIKQTLEILTEDPVLWYGNYVDFGDYTNSKNYCSSSEEPISLEFEFNIQKSYFINNAEGSLIRVKVCILDNGIQSINLVYRKIDIEIFFNEEKKIRLLINNIPFDEEVNVKVIPRYFLPIPLIGDNSRIYFFPDEEKIKNILKKYNIQYDEEKIRKFIKSIDESEYSYIKIKNNLTRYFGVEDKGIVKQIVPRIVSLLIPRLFWDINEALATAFNDITYIKPIRARVNRFYRVQGISVEKVDSDGNNAAMILYNMQSKEKKNFEECCKLNLGMFFSISDNNQNCSIIVQENDQDIPVNLADCGYGYSQILPIVLLLWQCTKRRLKTRQLIVIEQPELHLHPAFQSKIVSIMMEILKSNKSIKFLIETHSESLINSLGRKIIDSKIESDDINIIIVNKTKSESIVEQVKFDNNGIIKDWPIGFFSAEE